MTKHVKYPRTYHLQFSKGASSDDKIQYDLSKLEGAQVVVTLKMDGENTSLYNDKMHARSIDSAFHESRSWVKQWWGTWAHQLDDGIRVCGENLYAKHSIKYNDLETYFYGFSVWDNDICLSWDETLEYFELLGITPVQVLYDGVFDLKILEQLASTLDTNIHEGFVVRNKKSFTYSDFKFNVVKYVREGHVQTDQHWMNQEIEKNELCIKL